MKKSFATRSAIIGIGVAGSQVVGLLAIPFIARAFEQHEIGLYGIFFLTWQLLSMTLSLRYEQAIFMSSNSSERLHLIALSLFIPAILCPVIISVLFISSHFFTLDLSIFIWAVVAGGLGSFCNTLTASAIYTDSYFSVSASRLLRAVFAVLIQIYMGFTWKWGVEALILGDIIASIIGIVFLIMPLRAIVYTDERLSLRQCVCMARRYVQQPLLNLPNISLVGFTRLAMVSVVGYLANPAIAGQFFYMQRILQTPTVLISSSVTQVFFKDAKRELDSSGNFKRLFRKTFLFLTCASLTVCLPMVFAGRSVFSLVFGPEWVGAGDFASIFSVYIALQLIITVLSPTAQLANAQFGVLVRAASQSFALLVALAIGTLVSGSIYTGVICATLVTTPLQILNIAWLYSLSRSSQSRTGSGGRY